MTVCATASSLAQVDCAPNPQIALGLLALRQICAAPPQEAPGVWQGGLMTGEPSTSSPLAAEQQMQETGGQRRWRRLPFGGASGRPVPPGVQWDSLGITGEDTPAAGAALPSSHSASKLCY
jgi:hypothetical protein